MSALEVEQKGGRDRTHTSETGKHAGPIYRFSVLFAGRIFPLVNRRANYRLTGLGGELASRHSLVHFYFRRLPRKPALSPVLKALQDLAVMRVHLLTGRWLDQNDTAKSQGALLVNQAFAKRFFPGQEVRGKHLELMGDNQPNREIVGIVGNISHRALSDPQEPEMYVAYAQYAPPTMNLVVRAAADPSALAAALDETVRAIDKDETLSAIRSFEDIVASSVSQPRFSSLLLSLFAGLAVTLAAIGIYGAVAYSVSQRTNEIGIRLAVGAKQSDVLRIVVGQGMKLAGGGYAHRHRWFPCFRAFPGKHALWREAQRSPHVCLGFNWASCRVLGGKLHSRAACDANRSGGIPALRVA